MSQSQLGEALGLTFQQLQKYERGTNRISASKLYAAALHLKTPVAWFFEGLDQAQSAAADPEVEQRMSAMSAFLGSRDGAELALTAPCLPPGQRRQLLALIRSLAEDEA